jgi:predicted Zn finger-like uncharacterized protein
MAIEVTCPKCQSNYVLSDALQGKNVRCKKCGEAFRIAGGAPLAASPVVLQPVVRPEEIRSGIQASSGRLRSPSPQAEPIRSRRDYVDKPSRHGTSAIKILLIVFGSLAGLGLLTCGVVVYLGYQVSQTAKEKFEEIQANVEANAPVAAIDLSIKPPGNLDEALRFLKDGNVSKRHAGAMWLSRAPRDPGRQDEVARNLVSLLIDPNKQVRLACVKALDRWAIRDTVPALLELLNDDDVAIAEARQIAIHTLGRIKDERAVTPLAQRLTHFFDRDAAAKALQDMGPMAEPAVLQFAHHPDNATRESARRVLQTYHTKPEAILSQGIQDLKGADDYRKSVAEWLCQTPVNEGRRREVADALNPLLTDSRPDVRLAGLKALGVWGTPNEVPLIIRAVDDDSNEVRQSAIQTLVRLKDPRGVDAIAGRLTNFFDREQATRALQEMGPAAEKAVVKYYHHKDNDVRERARRLIQDYNTKPEVILEQTMLDLKSSEKDLRINCAEWLASQTPVEGNRKAVDSTLETLLTDMDYNVRIAGLKALGKWATKDNVPALIEVVKDREFTPWAGDARKLAMQTLGELKDERGAPVLALHLLNVFEREDAARALIAMGPASEKHVVSGLTNQDVIVRKLVCSILAEIGTKTSLTPLKKTVRGDPDQSVAAAALVAVNAITARAAATEKKEKESKPDSPPKDTKPEKPADKNAPRKKSTAS